MAAATASQTAHGLIHVFLIWIHVHKAAAQADILVVTIICHPGLLAVRMFIQVTHVTAGNDLDIQTVHLDLIQVVQTKVYKTAGSVADAGQFLTPQAARAQKLHIAEVAVVAKAEQVVPE